MAEIDQDVTFEEQEEDVVPEQEIRICLFTIGEDIYALPVETITEIILSQKVYPVPTTPPHVLGAINLRGSIVPIVDIRPALILPLHTRPSQIMLIQHEHVRLGIVVDNVSEIISVPESRFFAVPAEHALDPAAAGRNRFIKSIVHRDDEGGAAALLDIEQLYEAVKIA